VRKLFLREGVRFPRRGWAIALYVTLAFVSLVNGVRPSSAYGPFARFVTYAAGFFVVADVVRDKDMVRHIIWIVAVSGLAHAGISLSSGMGGGMRLSGLVEQPNELGVRLAFGAIACAGISASTSARWIRTTSLAAMVFILVAILLTVSRGTYISTAVAFGWWMRRRPRLVAVGLVAVTAMTVSVSMLGSSQVGFISRRLEMDDSSVRGRWQVMKNAVSVALERPLLGVGYGQFRYMHEGVDINIERNRGAHNFYLGSTASVGIPGTALLLFFAFSAARRLWRRRRRAETSAAPSERQVAWALGIIEMMLVYDAVSMLFRGGRTILLLTLLGIYVSASMLPEPSPEEEPT